MSKMESRPVRREKHPKVELCAREKQSLKHLRELWRKRDWKGVKKFAVGCLHVMSVWLQADGNAMMFVVQSPGCPTNESHIIFDPNTFYQMMHPDRVPYSVRDERKPGQV